MNISNFVGRILNFPNLAGKILNIPNFAGKIFNFLKSLRQDFEFSNYCRTCVNLVIFKILIAMSNCVRAELRAASSSTNFVYQKLNMNLNTGLN